MPLDPQSRKIRLMLAEKSLTARLVETAPWSGNPDLAEHNPALTVPVLIDEPPTGGEISVSPASAIAEYLEEAYGQPALMPAISAGRAEARRLSAWFDEKFEREVNARILRRRIDDRLKGKNTGAPDDECDGAEALAWHLDYISWLLESRAWLAGERMSVADLTGAAHLSAIDYIGAIAWSDFPHVKDWYAKMKSRPSFRPLLADRVKAIAPPPHYADPDF